MNNEEEIKEIETAHKRQYSATQIVVFEIVQLDIDTFLENYFFNNTELANGDFVYEKIQGAKN